MGDLGGIPSKDVCCGKSSGPGFIDGLKLVNLMWPAVSIAAASLSSCLLSKECLTSEIGTYYFKCPSLLPSPTLSKPYSLTVDLREP